LAAGVPASSTSDAVDLATEVLAEAEDELEAGDEAEELAVAGDELEAEDEAEELEDELEAESEEGTYGKQRFSALAKQDRSTFRGTTAIRLFFFACGNRGLGICVDKEI